MLSQVVPHVSATSCSGRCQRSIWSRTLQVGPFSHDIGIWEGWPAPAGQRRDALSLRPLLLSVSWGLGPEGELPDHWRRSFVVPLVRLLDLQMVSDEAVMAYWASKAMSCMASYSKAPLAREWAPS